MNLLRTNFYVAFWGSVAWGVVGAARNLMAAGAISSDWGPFSARILLAPFVLVGMQLLFFFGAYRPYGLEARPLMIFAGLGFLCLLLVMVLNQSMYDMAPGAFRYMIVAYVAVSHLGYGFFGRQ